MALQQGRMRRPLFLVGLAATVAFVAACGAGEPQSDTATGGADEVGSFKDRTISMVVNFSAGGGCDTGGRLLAQHLGDHAPGKPDIYVENVPGAGGLVAMNELFATSSTDGTDLGWLCGMMVPQALGVDAAKYDASQYQWVGAAYESQVLYAHKSLGVSSLAELADATGVISGGFAPDSTKDLGLKTLLNLRGADYKHVSGYPGNSELQVALERGEVNLHEETITGHLTSIQPMLKDGTLVAIAQRGVVDDQGNIIRDPRLPDVPTYSEAVKELDPALEQKVEFQALEALVKLDSFLRAVVYPPSTDASYVTAMRQAVADTIESPEFQKAAADSLGAEPLFVTGEAAQGAVAEIFDALAASPEASDYLKDMASAE